MKIVLHSFYNTFTTNFLQFYDAEINFTVKKIFSLFRHRLIQIISKAKIVLILEHHVSSNSEILTEVRIKLYVDVTMTS